VIGDLTFGPDVDESDIRVEEVDAAVVLTGSLPGYLKYVQAGLGRGSCCLCQMCARPPAGPLPPGDHRGDLAVAALASDMLPVGGVLPQGPRRRLARDQSHDRCARGGKPEPAGQRRDQAPGLSTALVQPAQEVSGDFGEREARGAVRSRRED
jgi:hypothetical protein